MLIIYLATQFIISFGFLDKGGNMLQNIEQLFKSIIPFVPTLIVVYAILKLMTSGLSLVTKAISTLALILLCYWAINYLTIMFL